MKHSAGKTYFYRSNVIFNYMDLGIMDYHEINKAYEEYLDQAWERYGEERNEYDPYAEAEAMWEMETRR